MNGIFQLQVFIVPVITMNKTNKINNPTKYRGRIPLYVVPSQQSKNYVNSSLCSAIKPTGNWVFCKLVIGLWNIFKVVEDKITKIAEVRDHRNPMLPGNFLMTMPPFIGGHSLSPRRRHVISF